MLTENQVKEHLALAYVYAVASRSACSFEATHVDMDSIDVKLALKNDDDAGALLLSPEISIQVKGQPLAEIPDGGVPFALKRKNQRDLVKKTLVPRLLVVVALPESPADWLSLSEDQLVLRRCGYWLNLLGEAPTDNVSTVTVYLPRAQRFDTDALQRLMKKAARQERLA